MSSISAFRPDEEKKSSRLDINLFKRLPFDIVLGPIKDTLENRDWINLLCAISKDTPLPDEEKYQALAIRIKKQSGTVDWKQLQFYRTVIKNEKAFNDLLDTVHRITGLDDADLEKFIPIGQNCKKLDSIEFSQSSMCRPSCAYDKYKLLEENMVDNDGMDYLFRKCSSLKSIDCYGKVQRSDWENRRGKPTIICAKGDGILSKIVLFTGLVLCPLAIFCKMVYR